MKKTIIFLLSMFLTNASADVKTALNYYKSKKKDKNAKVSFQLFEAKYYFSSAHFAKRHLIAMDKIEPIFEKTMERLLTKTGVETFADLPYSILMKHKSPTLSLTLGIRHFQEGRKDKAMKFLKEVPAAHRFYPDALFMLGSIANLQGKEGKAIEYYELCDEYAEEFQDEAAEEKLKRYYGILRESCTIHQARMAFRNKKYKESTKTFDSIPKTSYRWPYLLIEKAWSSYYQEDYNRTLGLLVSYKSPLLNSYFLPESEVLRALSYFRMCLYDDALGVIDNFYQVYKSRSEGLKGILSENKFSNNYFFNLMFLTREEKKDINPYVVNLATQIRKTVKFNLNLLTYRRAMNELKFIEVMDESGMKDIMLEEVEEAAKFRKRQLNHLIRKKMFSFINEIHKMSYEMFNIRLEITSRKRDLIYKNKKLIADGRIPR